MWEKKKEDWRREVKSFYKDSFIFKCVVSPFLRRNLNNGLLALVRGIAI